MKTDSWAAVRIRLFGSTARRRAGQVLLAVSSVAAGCAVTWLIWAAMLALWSWLAAPPSLAYQSWQTQWTVAFLRYPWAGYSPQRISVTLGVVAAGLLVSMAGTRWLPTRVRWWVLAAIALGAWNYLRLTGQSRWELYQWINEYPVTARAPTAVSAWSLAMWGTAAVVIASFSLCRGVSRRWWYAGAGAVLAAVIAWTTTVTALHAGDDRQFVDATTAGPAPIASLPAHLGQLRFSIRISGWNAPTLRDPEWRVESAGAGFVTLGDGKVTAYGPDGNERWHYRRTGPGGMQPNSLRVFDDGRTVVIGLGFHSVLIGLDALTGRQLWWSSDHPTIVAFDKPGDAPEYLASTSEDHMQWTRFDTRTGQRMWTKPAPAAECNGAYGGNPTFPAAAFRCATDPLPQLRFTYIEPATGEKRWRLKLLQGTQLPDAPDRGIWPEIRRAGSDGALIETYARSHTADTYISTYVNMTTRLARNLTGPTSSPVFVAQDRSSTSTSEDFLSDGPDGFHLFGPDGMARCGFPRRPGHSLNGSETLAVILGDDIVFGATERRGAGFVELLQTFHRSDCTPADDRSAPTTMEELLSAPGVVLAVHTDKTGTYVDGYRE